MSEYSLDLAEQGVSNNKLCLFTIMWYYLCKNFFLILYETKNVGNDFSGSTIINTFFLSIYMILTKRIVPITIIIKDFC